MSSHQPPVLRLLIGGFIIGAIGHVQGPVAMAAELLAGGPGVSREASLVRSDREGMASANPQTDQMLGAAEEAADDPAPTPPVATEAGIELGSDQSIDHLRKLVAAMEPQQAAAILEAIPVADAARIVTGLPVTTAVSMLSAMSAEGSAELTEELAKAPA
ncbi:MAG: hypothetical protein AAFR65_00220 [Pseudomonadota bacterium]